MLFATNTQLHHQHIYMITNILTRSADL